MVAASSLKTLGALGFAAALGYAHLQNNSDIDAYVQTQNLSKSEVAAFHACTFDTISKGLKLNTGQGHVDSNKVPREICVCQSRTMAKVFRDGEFSDHKLVVDYLVKGSGEQTLNENHLRPEARRGPEQFKRLTSSLEMCAEDYRQKVIAESNALKQQSMDRARAQPSRN